VRLPFRIHRIGDLDLLSCRFGPGGEAEMIVTTRRGGFSFGRRDLNVSRGTGDEADDVSHNRDKLLSALGLSSSGVAGLRQRHSDVVVEADESSWDRLVGRELNGDGLVTRMAGRWLSVGVGDCLPVALFDPPRRVIALLHAGWVGTANRIVEAALSKVVGEFGSNPADLHAVLGPCIRHSAYQVDGPVLERFGRRWRGWRRFVYDSGGGRAYLDLAGANRGLLLEGGVLPERIADFGLCTHALPALFFSHRRDGQPSGRMLVLAAQH